MKEIGCERCKGDFWQVGEETVCTPCQDAEMVVRAKKVEAPVGKKK